MEVLTRCLKCLETMSSRASVALVESRVTMGLRVIIWLTGVEWGSSPSAVTYCTPTIKQIKKEKKQVTHSVRQILRGKNSTKTFLIIDNENTVRTLGGTQLTSLGYGNVLWDGERRAGLESRDSSLGRGSLSRPLGGAALMSRYGAFSGELGLDFLPDGLALKGGINSNQRKREKKVSKPHPSWTAFSLFPTGGGIRRFGSLIWTT